MRFRKQIGTLRDHCCFQKMERGREGGGNATGDEEEDLSREISAELKAAPPPFKGLSLVDEKFRQFLSHHPLSLSRDNFSISSAKSNHPRAAASIPFPTPINSPLLFPSLSLPRFHAEFWYHWVHFYYILKNACCIVSDFECQVNYASYWPIQAIECQKFILYCLIW